MSATAGLLYFFARHRLLCEPGGMSTEIKKLKVYGQLEECMYGSLGRTMSTSIGFNTLL